MSTPWRRNGFSNLHFSITTVSGPRRCYNKKRLLEQKCSLSSNHIGLFHLRKKKSPSGGRHHHATQALTTQVVQVVAVGEQIIFLLSLLYNRIVIIIIMKRVSGPSLSVPPSPSSVSSSTTHNPDGRRRRRRRPSRQDDHFFFDRDLEQEEMVFERQQQQQQRQASHSYGRQYTTSHGCSSPVATAARTKKGQPPTTMQEKMVVTDAWQNKQSSYRHDNNHSMRHLMDEIMVEYGEDDNDRNNDDGSEDSCNNYCKKTAAVATRASRSNTMRTKKIRSLSPSLNRCHVRHERLLQEQYRRQREEPEADDNILLHMLSNTVPEDKEEEVTFTSASSSSSSSSSQQLQVPYTKKASTQRPFSTLERWDEDLEDDEFEVASLLRSVSEKRHSRMPSLTATTACGSSSETSSTTDTDSRGSNSSDSSSSMSSSGFSDNSRGSSNSANSGGGTGSSSSSGISSCCNNSRQEHGKSRRSLQSSCSTTSSSSSSSSSSLFIKSEDDDHDDEGESRKDDGAVDNEDDNNHDDDNNSYHGAYFLQETRKWAAGETPHYLIQLMDNIWKAGQPLQFKIYRKFGSMGEVEEVPHKVFEGDQIIQWIRGWIEYYEWYFTPCSWSFATAREFHRFKQAKRHVGSSSTRSTAPRALQNEVTIGNTVGENNPHHPVVLFDFCIMKSDLTLINIEHDELIRYCQEEIEARERGFNMLLSRRVAYIGGLSPSMVANKTIQTTIRPTVKQFFKPMAKQPHTPISPAGGSSSGKAIDVVRPYKHYKSEPKKTHRRTQSTVFQFHEF
jgi:hypothetical protein